MSSKQQRCFFSCYLHLSDSHACLSERSNPARLRLSSSAPPDSSFASSRHARQDAGELLGAPPAAGREAPRAPSAAHPLSRAGGARAVPARVCPLAPPPGAAASVAPGLATAAGSRAAAGSRLPGLRARRAARPPGGGRSGAARRRSRPAAQAPLRSHSPCTLGHARRSCCSREAVRRASRRARPAYPLAVSRRRATATCSAAAAASSSSVHGRPPLSAAPPAPAPPGPPVRHKNRLLTIPSDPQTPQPNPRARKTA